MSASQLERTTFLVDGFNLYHSIRQAADDAARAGLPQPHMKWLDLRSLCASYLHLIGRGAELRDVYYFSALATHLEAVKPDVVVRHKTLISALSANGVSVELGRFKEKTLHCPSCNKPIIRHEEKETDVAISLKLIELFLRDACDVAVFITGDTDIAPAVRTAHLLFPQKRVLFAFPYGRKNKELAKLAPGSFQIARDQYARFQFANTIQLPDGSVLTKPSNW
jgi:NYN domain